MKSKYVIGVLVLMIFSGSIVINPYRELNRVKQRLAHKEQQLSSILKKHDKMQKIAANLQQLHEIKTSNLNKKLLEQIIAPTINDNSKENYNITLKDPIAGNNFLQYPVTIEFKSSFNRAGDYLTFLERKYPPVIVDVVSMTPATGELDLVHTRLLGSIYLPK